MSVVEMDPDQQLQNLQDMLSILEELGTAENSQIGFNLVDEKRYLLTAEDAEIRIGSKDAKQSHCRFYLFNDLMIIAKYKSKKQKGLTIGGGTSGKIFFGDLIGRKDSLNSFDSSEKDSDSESESNGRPSIGPDGKKKKKRKGLKLKVWLDLNRVRVRKISKEGQHGMKIVYTTREEHHDEETGGVEHVTKVEQSELWFDSKDVQDKLTEYVHEAIDICLEAAMSYNKEDNLSDSGDDDSTDGGESSSAGSRRKPKKRSYVKGKDTMRQIARRRNRGTLNMKETQGGDFSLEDIAKRYQITTGGDSEKDETAEFSVVFKEGGLGFALSSMAGTPGCFVSKLDDHGMAENSGVTLMDRVVSINGEYIDDTMDWKSCVMMIKRKRGQKDSEGNPKPLVVKFARRKAVDDTLAAATEQEEKKAEIKRIKKQRGGKRAWAKKRDAQRTFGERVSTLDDLKKKYKDPEANSNRQSAINELFDKIIAELKKPDCKSPDAKSEKNCVYILKEIHDTEKAYVHTLYHILDTYKKRLEKARVAVRCKDLKVTTRRFCEHRIPAFSCSKVSSKILPICQKSDIKQIFSNISALVKVNEQLLTDIQDGLFELNRKRAKHIDLSDLIEVYVKPFTKIMPFFKLYSTYATQYSNALEHLDTLMERREFAQELRKLEERKNVPSLKNILMNPVSRLTKYPLLFETLLNSVRPYGHALATQTVQTGEGDMVRLEQMMSSLDETFNVVKSTAESVNLTVGESIDLGQLGEIYAELGGKNAIRDFMIPSRRFLNKYDLMLVDNKAKKPKPVLLYVFNDLLIFATEKGGTMKFGSGMKSKSIGKSSRWGSDKRSNSGSKTSKKKSLGRITLKKQKVKIIDHFPIVDCKVKKLNKTGPDEMEGITLQKITRTSTEKKTKRKSQKAGGKKEAKVETFVSNMELYAYDVSIREEMADLIEKNKNEQKENIKIRKAALAKVQKKKYRTWKTMGGSSASRTRQASMKKKLSERSMKAT